MQLTANDTAVLRQSEIADDLTLLDRVWENPNTFAVLPDRCPVSLERIEAALQQLPQSLRRDHFILLTSGTCGEPKLVIGSRTRAEALASVLHDRQQSEPIEQTIVTLPLSYTYAFVNQWVWSRRFRREIAITGGWSDARRVREALDQARNAMICLVGIQVPLLSTYFAGCSFPGVIRAHFAGGRFPQERIEELRTFFPNATIFNNYGCAEAMPRLTVRLAEDAAEATNVGWPLPGVSLRTSYDGALQFQSAYGAVGYINDHGFHEITSADWVATGDLGEQEANGTWRLAGRASEVFKRHGEKVSIPSMLTETGRCFDGQAFAYRQRDRDGEDGWVLVLTPHPAEGQVQALLRLFRSSFPRTHWPLRVESIDSPPLLANGKPDLQAMAVQDNRLIHWQQRI